MVNNNKIDFWIIVQIVLVQYNEELFHCKTFKSLENAKLSSNIKLDLFVYDNSPSPLVPELIHERFNITYFSDTNNGGLSKAYNRGFKIAIENKKKYVILLDQDTEFSIDFYEKYYNAISLNPTIDIFAPKLMLSNGKIFSPSIYKFKRGWHPSSVNTGINVLGKLVPVNSGVVISKSLFTKVGGYNENLRVDFIDFEFMERLKKHTNIFWLIDIVGYQEFSNETTDIYSAVERFKIYLTDVKSIPKYFIIDNIIFFLIVLAHTLKMSVKYRTIKFMKLFIND